MNDPGAKHFYKSPIPDPTTGNCIIAPYIRYHKHTTHTEVSLTFGDGYPTTTRVLRPIQTNYVNVPIAPGELPLLDPDSPFAYAVDKVVNKYFPWELTTTLQQYQYFRRRQYEVQKIAKKLQDKETAYLEKAMEELSALENANFLGRLMAYEDDIFTELEPGPAGNAFSTAIFGFAGVITQSATDPTPNPWRNRRKRTYTPKEHKQIDEFHLARMHDDPLAVALYQKEIDGCRRPPQSQKKSKARCHKCHRKGHYRKECPMNFKVQTINKVQKLNKGKRAPRK
jgi:hypothetical protein